MNASVLRSYFYLALFTTSLLGGTLAAHAQQQEQPAQREPEILRLRRFSGLGTKNFVKTPEYKTNAPRGISPQKEWFRIITEYDTAPEWIDELTFQYFILSLTTVDRAPSYSIFRVAVRYSDIAAGRGHLSTAFLHPKALERFGEVVAVAVEILHEGRVIAEETDVRGSQIPPDWWQNPQVTESETVTARNGYLLDRSQSPFALINIDDYEFIK